MAIAPVSSISSLSQIPGPGRVGAVGRAANLPPVEAIVRLSREPFDRGAEANDAKEEGLAPAIAEPGPAPALDRRSAAALLGEDRGAASRARGEPATQAPAASEQKPAAKKPWEVGARTESEIRDKLAALEGEKSRKEGEKQSEASQRSSEVTSLISRLKARDGEVRAHESAHIAAGGRYITGGASFSYQRGPDGAQYAIGGEVGIDSSPIPGKPEETIAKMRIVRAAALAPAEPSGADLAVAGAAAQAEASAVAELADRRGQEVAKAGAPRPETGAESPSGPAAEAARPASTPPRLAYGGTQEGLPGANLDLVA